MEDTLSDRRRPNMLEKQYGQEQYERGYAAGYAKHASDMRRIRSSKERSIIRKFNDYIDYMEDVFADNRKR